MPYKDPEVRKAHYKKYYKRYRREKANSITLLAYHNHQIRKKIWRNFLVDAGLNICSRCGYDECIEAIDFHHTDPGDKEYNIAHLTTRAFTKPNIELFLSELDKCIILCANCHRLIHSKR